MEEIRTTTVDHPHEWGKDDYADFLLTQQTMALMTRPGPPLTFASYLENKKAAIYYETVKRQADPNCPQCHGEGYLPVVRGNGVADACSCLRKEGVR